MSIIELLDRKFRQNQVSYMMVTVLAFLNSMMPNGTANFSEVVENFKDYYIKRINTGKVPEKQSARMSNATQLKDSQIRTLLLEQPLQALRGLIDYDERTNTLQFKEDLTSELNWKTEKELRKTAFKHLYRYYKDIESNQLTAKDLNSLAKGYAVTALDVAAVSGQNQMKGIHPVEKDDSKCTIILCTLEGGMYANSWLDREETVLKYYLEGRTKEDGTKTYNEQAKSNQSVILSKEENYPIYVFTRDKKGDLFHYEGKFQFERVDTETSGDKFFILKAKDIKGDSQVPPVVSRERILEAMVMFDNEMRNTADWQGWESRGNQKYAVLNGGNKYPPKQIVSMATGVVVGELSGGAQANSYLRQRGFEVIEFRPDISVAEVVQHIHNYIAAKGFVFDEDLVKNLYLSLKTKPFVILAGISGTGKSKIGELLAEAVGATTDNGRFRLIPVRPDWNDSSDLLGYQNLQGTFVDGPLIKVIRDAMADSDKPYFVCLDEMNLARVEYYFSDFLSIIESRKFEDGQIRSHGITMNGNGDKLYFPKNLYVIGTVNMDETTHSFSRKVLDRANTIELMDVDLTHFPVAMANVVEAIDRSNDLFESSYLLMKDCFVEHEDYVRERVTILESINNIIGRCGFQVGYRVRDEFCFYLIYNQKWGLISEDKAVDFQIMQKILPRIQGSASEIDNVLKELREFCENKYPASMKKIDFMLRRLESDGFTSFWP